MLTPTVSVIDENIIQRSDRIILHLFLGNHEIT